MGHVQYDNLKNALASIGFEALAGQIDKKPKSIKRMLSEKGNPTPNNMAALFSSLKQHERVSIDVEVRRQAK